MEFLLIFNRILIDSASASAYSYYLFLLEGVLCAIYNNSVEVGSDGN